MESIDQSKFVKGLQQARHNEQLGQRIYLTQIEKNEVRCYFMFNIAETEYHHGEHWVIHLHNLIAETSSYWEVLNDRDWSWKIVMSGIDNALMLSENYDTKNYKSMAQLATSKTDRTVNRTVLHDKKNHGSTSQRISGSTSISFQSISGYNHSS